MLIQNPIIPGFHPDPSIIKVGKWYYITNAADIRGPWSTPVYLNSGGFDASLFHDETDGTAWLVQMKWDFQPGHDLFRGIYMRQLKLDDQKLIGESRCIFKGTERGFTKGPHLYRHGKYYYLMTAEGGTRDTHCITMERVIGQKTVGFDWMPEDFRKNL